MLKNWIYDRIEHIRNRLDLCSWTWYFDRRCRSNWWLAVVLHARWSEVQGHRKQLECIRSWEGWIIINRGFCVFQELRLLITSLVPYTKLTCYWYLHIQAICRLATTRLQHRSNKHTHSIPTQSIQSDPYAFWKCQHVPSDWVRHSVRRCENHW